MGKGYSRNGSTARSAKSSGVTGLVGGKLEEIAREGAQRMLAEALELEVDEFLQRARYARGQEFRDFGMEYIPPQRPCAGADGWHRHGPGASQDAAGERCACGGGGDRF